MVFELKVRSEQHIENEDAEKILSQFYDECTLSDTLKHQLWRMLRELRGLPPQAPIPVDTAAETANVEVATDEPEMPKQDEDIELAPTEL